MIRKPFIGWLLNNLHIIWIEKQVQMCTNKAIQYIKNLHRWCELIWKKTIFLIFVRCSQCLGPFEGGASFLGDLINPPVFSASVVHSHFMCKLRAQRFRALILHIKYLNKERTLLKILPLRIFFDSILVFV